MDEQHHSGNKYHRTIYDVKSISQSMNGPKIIEPITVDVYSVLNAFNVKCPATQHAIKKLLCAGIRGKGDKTQDLTEARDAISRAIDFSQLECKHNQDNQ